MALIGDEVRRRLGEFASRWGGYRGSERAEAQTFLAQLLTCYGIDRQEVGARFEDRAGDGFMDMLWPGVCLVEMKRPSEAPRLEEHRAQAFEYWKRVGRPGAPAPPFVVVCAFHRFQVYKPDEGWDRAQADFELSELPEHQEALAFLAGRRPSFESQAVLTRDAVARITDLYHRLEERLPDEADVVRDFVLQCVWTLFAEDLDLLQGRVFTDLLDELLADPRRSSVDDLGQLFRYLATPGERPNHGLYAGTPYVDGGLFEHPAALHLEAGELQLLREAAAFDWTRVEPAIFGALLEGTLGPERQWALGAHYTSEADILKCVLPTVIEPWRDRIDGLETLPEVEAAEGDFQRYVVLDPACGSGNFLYVAYRNLRRLEVLLHERAHAVRAAAGLRDPAERVFYPLTNLRGIEIEPFAVLLARVTLWMGHKLAVDELDIAEPVLPLADLSGIWNRDALEVEWPRADAIVGNPPYIGTKLMRSRLGDDYLVWLRAKFGVGVKDYCVYWFRKASDSLSEGGRAGLVGTNSVREGKNRRASLDYIVENGGVITDAVSDQPWSGAANVHVSIVNWVKQGVSGGSFVLDGVDVVGISTQLRPSLEVLEGVTLAANSRRQFFGVVPSGDGFILTLDEAGELRRRTDADYTNVVRPYLIGDDITKRPGATPSRWIINFHEMTLEQAAAYPAALDIVRARVRPARSTHRKKREREQWWKLSRTVQTMFEAIEPHSRFVACPATAKHFFMVWCEWDWCPSNATSVFAFSDDYSMGLLCSGLHSRWAVDVSTKLETRPRYTSASFATFPWPSPTYDQREAIADLSRRLIARRQEICVERQIGLTQLYNEVDDGAYRDLAELHSALDEAVGAAYGWPATVVHDPDDSNRRLLELNRAITAGEIEYAPFG